MSGFYILNKSQIDQNNFLENNKDDKLDIKRIYVRAATRENWALGFRTRSDTNRSVLVVKRFIDASVHRDMQNSDTRIDTRGAVSKL